MKYWYILITKKWYLGVWIISLQYYKIWGIWGHQVSDIRWGSLLFFRILLSNRSKSWSWSWRCSCLVLSCLDLSILALAVGDDVCWGKECGRLGGVAAKWRRRLGNNDSSWARRGDPLGKGHQPNRSGERANRVFRFLVPRCLPGVLIWGTNYSSAGAGARVNVVLLFIAELSWAGYCLLPIAYCLLLINYGSFSFTLTDTRAEQVAVICGWCTWWSSGRGRRQGPARVRIRQ